MFLIILADYILTTTSQFAKIKKKKKSLVRKKADLLRGNF